MIDVVIEFNICSQNQYLLWSQAAPTQTNKTSNSSIFGAAKPREEVLQSKGIDPKDVEKKVERKASIVRLTGENGDFVFGCCAWCVLSFYWY